MSTMNTVLGFSIKVLIGRLPQSLTRISSILNAGETVSALGYHVKNKIKKPTAALSVENQWDEKLAWPQGKVGWGCVLNCFMLSSLPSFC